MDFERDNRRRIKQFWADKIYRVDKLAANSQYVFPRSKISLKECQQSARVDYRQPTISENQRDSITSIADIYDLHHQNTGYTSPNIHNNSIISKNNHTTNNQSLNFQQMCQASLSNMLYDWQPHKSPINQLSLTKQKNSTQKNKSRNSSKAGIKIKLTSVTANAYKTVNSHENQENRNVSGGKIVKRKYNIQKDFDESYEEKESKCCMFFREFKRKQMGKQMGKQIGKQKQEEEIRSQKLGQRQNMLIFKDYMDLKSSELKSRKIKQIVSKDQISGNGNLKQRSISAHPYQHQHKQQHQHQQDSHNRNNSQLSHKFPLSKTTWNSTRSKSLTNKSKITWHQSINSQFTINKTDKTSINQFKI